MKQTKREVAAEAARIIATEGQHNYHAAKRKAASRIGVSERLALPSNIDVQEALRCYLNLYGGAEHSRNLEEMRETAIEVMQFLEPFPSRLVGAVLDGTATAHARITVHVFSDLPDDIVHHMMERGVPFRQEQRRIRWHDDEHRTLAVLILDHPPFKVDMMLFEAIQLRQAPPCPIDGKPQKRAAIQEVRELLMTRQAEPVAAA